MKRFSIVFLLTGIISVFFVSCNKNDDNENPPIYVFPSAAVAEYIGMAFSNATKGINYHMETATLLAATTNFIDTNFTLKKTDSTATVKYLYTIHYDGNRVAASPPKYTFNYAAEGSFQTNSLSSTDKQNGSYSISGLEVGDVSFLMTGSGTDDGLLQSKGYNVDFSAKFSYSLKNVEMDKFNYKVTSGSATLHANGIGPAYILFSYTGTITFNGDRKATLVLDNKTYDMNLETGVVGKK